MGGYDFFGSSQMNGQDYKIICAGSVLWDIIGYVETDLCLGEDKGGKIERRPGGVAFNIAQKLSRLGLKPIMLSAIGQDEDGKQLIEHCKALGCDMQYVHMCSQHATDRYMAIEDKNGLVAAVADARALESQGHEILKPLKDGRLGSLENPSKSIVILDGNLTSEQFLDLAISPVLSKCALKLAAASPAKVDRLRVFSSHPSTVLYCNLSEAEILTGQNYESSQAASRGLLDMGFSRAVVTNGSEFACDSEQNVNSINQKPTKVSIQGVTGAGDIFMAAHIFAEISGCSRQEALDVAIMSAGNYVSGKDVA